MVETVKEYIEQINLPKNEYIESYFYVNRNISVVEYNGQTTPLENDGLSLVEFWDILIKSHAESYFKIKNGNSLFTISRLKDEFNYLIGDELKSCDIETIEFKDESIDDLAYLLSTRFIFHSSLLFIDLSKITQFIAGKIFLTFNIVKDFDEFFIENDLTRIYKHNNSFFIMNYGN